MSPPGASGLEAHACLLFFSRAAHNPRKFQHQLDVEVALFPLKKSTANVEGFEAILNHFRLTLEVAINNSYGVTPDCYGTS
jgi:hypothetical protein